MKVGHIINGLTVTDVKRVNKLNLIQFLKEVDSYLQKGYKLNVTSGRQVGLVLMVDVYKTEAASNIDVGSTGDASIEAQGNTEAVTQKYVPEETVVKVEHNGEVVMNTTVDKLDSEVPVKPEPTEQQEGAVDAPTEDEVIIQAKEEVVEEQAPVAPKKTTTRSKKIAQ